MDNWAKIEFLFLYKLRVQKHDLRKLEFWDVEQTLDLWQEQMEREKEEHSKQEKMHQKQAAATNTPGSYKPPKATMPKTPNYGGFKIPTPKIPGM